MTSTAREVSTNITLGVYISEIHRESDFLNYAVLKTGTVGAAARTTHLISLESNLSTHGCVEEEKDSEKDVLGWN
jgi:hypothetical protein